MVGPAKEKPLPLQFYCSDQFWEEDSSGIPSSELFHYYDDIKGRRAAIIIDNSSLTNFVSIEVVEKLQLYTSRKRMPYLYMLANYEEALPITHFACVPLTIYGHTVRITCDVIPRAINCCHLLLENNGVINFRLFSIVIILILVLFGIICTLI